MTDGAETNGRMKPRLAVVLFNLGGPDSLDAVEPFLRNLFGDPAIIGLPWPFRAMLAWLIARRRRKTAQHIYAQLGGASPLLPLTRQQADALQLCLQQRGWSARVFVCMRYWHPRAASVVQEVRSFAPERVVLLPLYPQYSTTTTGSSLSEWRQAATAVGLQVPSSSVCCYPTQLGFVAAVAEQTRDAIRQAGLQAPFRILFSAHGLPKRVVASGDPYQWQVEQTTAAVVAALGPHCTDHVICYQSRVGPLEWIGPSTEDEIARAGAERMAIVVVPIAFVSEHSETLVELDVDYRAKAEALGVPAYVRVASVGSADTFIDGLADLTEEAISRNDASVGSGGAIVCPPKCGRCPLQELSVITRDAGRNQE